MRSDKVFSSLLCMMSTPVTIFDDLVICHVGAGTSTRGHITQQHRCTQCQSRRREPQSPSTLVHTAPHLLAFPASVLSLHRSMLLQDCVRACREELVHALVCDPA